MITTVAKPRVHVVILGCTIPAVRPPHIILFPLPIILFSNSQNDPLLFLYNSFLCESAHYSFFPAHVGNRGGAKAVQEA